jgi:hypothetical protein
MSDRIPRNGPTPVGVNLVNFFGSEHG